MWKPYTSVPLSSPHPITKQNYILIPKVRVRLGIKGITTPRFDAVVDSGCPYCLFHADFAKLLKLDLEAGIPVPIQGVHGGSFNFDGVLGRNGFFDNFYVTFDQSEEIHELEIRRIERLN